MTTRGDQILDRTLSKVGGKGLFVKELETALEEGRAAPRGAFAEGRADGPARRLRARRGARARGRRATLSSRRAMHRSTSCRDGARVGTSSLRRVVQLRALRPDLQRRAAARQPRHAAAQARRRPLRRDRAGRRRPDSGSASSAASAPASTPTQMIPCAGQGALGIEVRADASALRERSRR